MGEKIYYTRIKMNIEFIFKIYVLHILKMLREVIEVIPSHRLRMRPTAVHRNNPFYRPGSITTTMHDEIANTTTPNNHGPQAGCSQ